MQPIVMQRGGKDRKKRKREQQIDGSQRKGKKRIGIEFGDSKEEGEEED